MGMTKRPKKIMKRKTGAAKLSRTKSMYRFNEGFADKAKEKSRKQYRKAKGGEFELTGQTVLRSLDFIEEECLDLVVQNTMTLTQERHPVMRLKNVAALLDVSYQSLWRWTSETDQLPQPVLIDTSSGREYDVYHLEEVRIMVQVIGEHLGNFKYYRKDHEGTRSKLFDQINALRATNFNSGDKRNGSQSTGKEARRKSRSR